MGQLELNQTILKSLSVELDPLNSNGLFFVFGAMQGVVAGPRVQVVTPLLRTIVFGDDRKLVSVPAKWIIKGIGRGGGFTRCIVENGDQVLQLAVA